MSHPSTQHIKNHTRFSPPYHFVVVPILIINFIDSVHDVYLAQSWSNILNVLVAIALILLALTARAFVLTVQDRVIRLEEQMRFERLFPEDLRVRIPEFTRDQFVALRFASDHELPMLARQVLDQRITDRSAIKQMIQEWRPDYFRA